MGLETLYHYCEIARELTMKDEWKVGRVIARPYVGKKKGEFVRTANRHDYAVKTDGKNRAQRDSKEAGYECHQHRKNQRYFLRRGHHGESEIQEQRPRHGADD